MVGIVNPRSEVLRINKNDSVSAAAAKMRDFKVGSLVVVNDDDKPEGIVTEKDVVTKAVACSLDIHNIPVSAIMTSDLISCAPDTSMSKARQLMAEHRIRHLPVMTDQQVTGMLSMRDVVEQQLKDDKTAAEQIAMLSTCLKSIDLDDVLSMITKELPKLFNTDKCLLCFYQGTSPQPSLLRAQNCRCQNDNLKTVEEIQSIESSGRCCRCDICHQDNGSGVGFVIPLTIEGHSECYNNDANRMAGYICMCGLPSDVAKNHELLKYKADLVLGILRSHLTNALEFQKVKHISLTDALTGVGSRKLLENRLEAERTRSERYRYPYSVAIIDLDKFKTINDRFGHAFGDSMLKKLADCLKKCTRASDMVARYGGDEFVILMPQTKCTDAVAVMERIRESVNQVIIAPDQAMGISCGVVERGGERLESIDELMRCADLALYEAKKAGRNCVKTWEPVAII